MKRYGQRITITLGVILVIVALWQDYQREHLTLPEPEVEFSSSIESNFQLTDQDGKPLSNRDMFGKYQLVYFGFTHCPDICPVGLGKIDNVLKILASDNNEVVPLFITLDPERDSPDVMKEYLANFSPKIKGLTGDRDAINMVAKNFKVAHEKHTDDHAEEPTINHSGYMFLMDRNGRNTAIFSQEYTAEKIASIIKEQLRKEQNPVQ